MKIKKEDLQKAAAILKITMPKSSVIDIEGFLYGSYSYEAWAEIWQAMKSIKYIKTDAKYYDDTRNYEKISLFNDLLRKSKLINIEW